MKKVVTYESFDQEVFFTEEECRDYEAKYAYKVKMFIECYSYYDATMVEIVPPDTNDIEENLTWIENSYSDSEYVRVKKIRRLKLFHLLKIILVYIFHTNVVCINLTETGG